MNKNKNIFIFTIIVTMSIIVITSCSKQKEIKNTDIDTVEPTNMKDTLEDIIPRELMTASKDLMYSHVETLLSTITNYSDSQNIGNDEWYQEIYNDKDLKLGTVYIMEAFLYNIEQIPDKSLTEDEIQLKESVIELNKLETAFLEFTQSKYDIHKEKILLTTMEDTKLYDDKRNEIISLIKENIDLIKKVTEQYHKLVKYDTSKPFGYNTFVYINDYVSEESEENQIIINEFQSQFFFFFVMPYFIDKETIGDEVNYNFNQIIGNYQLIKEMDIYKKNEDIQTFFDDLISVTKNYQPLENNALLKEIEFLLQNTLNDIVPIYYKYYDGEIISSFITDKHLK